MTPGYRQHGGRVNSVHLRTLATLKWREAVWKPVKFPFKWIVFFLSGGGVGEQTYAAQLWSRWHTAGRLSFLPFKAFTKKKDVISTSVILAYNSKKEGLYFSYEFRLRIHIDALYRIFPFLYCSMRGTFRCTHVVHYIPTIYTNTSNNKSTVLPLQRYLHNGKTDKVPRETKAGNINIVCKWSICIESLWTMDNSYIFADIVLPHIIHSHNYLTKGP